MQDDTSCLLIDRATHIATCAQTHQVREANAGFLLGTGSNMGFHPRMRLAPLKEVTVPMPARLALLRFPKALDDRLHHLLDEQGRRGSLVAAERREAEALVNIATTLSILKLTRLRLRPKTTRPKTTRPKTQDEEFDLTTTHSRFQGL
jgi:hypothetical protein